MSPANNLPSGALSPLNKTAQLVLSLLDTNNDSELRGTSLARAPLTTDTRRQPAQDPYCITAYETRNREKL